MRRPALFQTVVVVIIALATLVDAITSAVAPDPLGRFAVVAATVAGAIVAWRRPWSGLGILSAGALLTIPLHVTPLPIWSTLIFSVFALALRGMPALPAGALVAVVDYLVVMTSEGTGPWNATASIAAALALAAAASGSAIRGHYRYLAELDHSSREALATKEAEGERRIAEERLRIARDLHDAVGHEIALIGMHLGAAEVHLPPGADAAQADLVAARSGVKAVLRETQEILAVLRIASAEAPAGPVADVARIADLVASYRAGGLTVDGSLTSAPAGLASETSAAAYRIVQEALTNAQRYGTGAVTLRVEQQESMLVIEAVNVKAAPGTGVPTGSGFGLVGMRERVQSVGGTLVTRDEATLFWLRASLPLEHRSTP